MSRLVEVTFSLLYVAGTGVMGFGILMGMTPSLDHTLDLSLFAAAAGLFLLAALIAALTWKSKDIWHPPLIVLSFMTVQFSICLGLGWDAYTHLHTM